MDIVHEYFKKELEGDLILIQVNPANFQGKELLVSKEGAVKLTPRSFDEDIFDDLNADEFDTASPLEFNLYLKGLHKS